jgi:hypothetical protein
MSELTAFLHEAPNPSLSLTSDIGGAYYLVKPLATIAKPKRHLRDQKGRSIPARMAMYTGRMLRSSFDFDLVPQQYQAELVYLLALSIELASDQITCEEPAGLWTFSDDAAEEIESFVSDGRRTINGLLDQATGWSDGSLGHDHLVERLLAIMLRQARDLSPMALYSAKAMSNLLQALTERHGPPPDTEQRFLALDIKKATPANVLPAVAFISGFGEMLRSSKALSMLCNKLVSEMAGAFSGLGSTLATTVLLNACFSIYEAGKVPVENRRMAIALKHMTSWTDVPDEMCTGLAAETCKGLHRLVPNVAQVYGPYWEQAIAFCIHLWEQAEEDPPAARLPYLHASLRLVMTLESLPDPNDDLEDALAKYSRHVSQALLHVIKIPREGRTQASDIVDSLLRRRVEQIPLSDVDNYTDLYRVVASESRDVQSAAFLLLRKAIPKQQEMLAVDRLLDQKGSSLLVTLHSYLLLDLGG